MKVYLTMTYLVVEARRGEGGAEGMVGLGGPSSAEYKADEANEPRMFSVGFSDFLTK